MKIKKLYLIFYLAVGFALFLFVSIFNHPGVYIKHQEPKFLTFSELKSLSKSPNPNLLLKLKLNKFWRTPIISNEAYYNGAKPHNPNDPKLGSYLRLVTWNIEKSYEMENAIKAFSSADEFRPLIDSSKVQPGTPDYENILRQRDKLSNADVILLQETDIGHKRSNYINAARELAGKLKMNYAYGAEQLEVDPVYLGLEKIVYENGDIDQEATDYYAVDKGRYKGVFGCAVLSRYPIKRAEVFQLKNQSYDWHRGETLKFGFLEKARRSGAKIVFKNEITREIKVGGRTYFRVDLAVPGLPHGTLTIINIHLEIKCLPEGREAQMDEILSYIKGIKNPVIVAGDFNSAPHDLSATSVARVAKRTAKNPETWFSVGTSVLLPYALAINATRLTTKLTRNFQDPTAKNIPVLLPNPVKPLFGMIEGFRFQDGGVFDFRGDAERSINGNDGTLANSNQRDMKGFKTTFSTKRTIAELIGKYRLDWVFVKSFLKESRDPAGPYRFAPHFGETLEEMNTSLSSPISDHHPSVVDIPFGEPKL